MARRIFSIVALVSQLACVSVRPPGTFADGGPFHANTLELKADGTFSYEAWTDDGGAFWRAEGTWKWIDRDRFVTEIVNVSLGAQLECGPLSRYQIWQVTTRGVIRDTRLFAPKRDGV